MSAETRGLSPERRRVLREAAVEYRHERAFTGATMLQLLDMVNDLEGQLLVQRAVDQAAQQREDRDRAAAIEAWMPS